MYVNVCHESNTHVCTRAYVCMLCLRGATRQLLCHFVKIIEATFVHGISMYAVVFQTLNGLHGLKQLQHTLTHSTKGHSISVGVYSDNICKYIYM